MFLRGLGTLVALPMLESMLPRGRLFAAGPTADAGPLGSPRRMVYVYAANGKNMTQWTPAADGAGFALSPTLEPLASHRNDITVLSGLSLDPANAHGDGGGDHARGLAAFLTGVHPKKTAGADIRAGVSVDQIAAQHIGDQTRFRSLELSCDKGPRAGTCDSGFSCAYQYNIAWRSETMPVNPEVDPRALFDRLFSDPEARIAPEMRARRKLLKKSMLDFVLDDTHRLNARVSTADREKLDQYLTSVREIEQRIERAGQLPIPTAPQGFDRPANLGDMSYDQHLGLMYELLALALQTDQTRIATFITAHEGSNRPYPFIDVPDGHHDISHHGRDEERLTKLARINRFHVAHFARFLDRLKSVQEGEQTLLDNCMIVYGSSISDPDKHSHDALPVLLAGRGGGTIKAGRHIRVKKDTPITNLYVSVLDRMGVSAQKVGDSNGKLEEIA